MTRLAAMALLLLALAAALPGAAGAQQRKSDIAGTKHNLSATSANTVKASTEDEICVFCHTPHGGTSGMSPLWNRQVDGGGTSYEMYQSMSMNASKPASPQGTSKLCLSCHDGTIALGNVDVLNGAKLDSADISMSHTHMPADTHTNEVTGGTMGSGEGQYSGFTRLIGTDLTNDHPISIDYSSAVTNDNEMHAAGGAVADRGTSPKPTLPLEGGRVECTSCHDPHLKNPEKFLRANRLQKAGTSFSGSFDAAQDQICLACHNKAGWAESSHAIATQTYTDTAAGLREFYNATIDADGNVTSKDHTNVTVAQAGCLNCHDTHTAPGSRRLLREGIHGPANLIGARLGNTATNKRSAIENTCFMCHSTDGGVLSNTSNVPNIKTDFTYKLNSKGYWMPLYRYRNNGTDDEEVHDIGDLSAGGWGSYTPDAKGAGADFLEAPNLLGKLGSSYRHVECTDCHNPHRVRRAQRYDDTSGASTVGTHVHVAGTKHTNLISGVLYGSWGVEPSYPTTSGPGSWSDSATFDTANNIKRGLPAAGLTEASDPLSTAGVTREYQICLKCHSSFAYGNTPPTLPSTNDEGGTVYDSDDGDGIQQYTDQSREFRAPTADMKEANATNSPNHRSWHPVMRETGRTLSERGNMNNANGWLEPWKFVGTQTMYCSDCHGSNTANGTVEPSNPGPGQTQRGVWGPHGSTNPFILKGGFSSRTGVGNQGDICFKCHDYGAYATGSTSADTGFCCDGRGNLHAYHASKIRRNGDSGMTGLYCSWCHIAVPHGWRNKALLVNLNEVGKETDFSESITSAPAASTVNGLMRGYYKPPYYLNAFNRVVTWQKSKAWTDTSCGTSSSNGVSWMKVTCMDVENSPPLQ